MNVSSPLGRWSWSLSLACALAAVACGEDGVTPSCPELPLYDASDPETLNDPEIQEAINRAVREHCVTPRAGEVTGAAGSP
jgi:hypothetical protein